MANAASSRSSNRREDDPTLPAADYVEVARIATVRGLAGKVKAIPLTDKLEVFTPSSEVLLSLDTRRQFATVTALHRQKDFLVLSFSGITTREEAELWRGGLIMVRRGQIPKEEDEFFYDELIGLSVVTTDGLVLGKVAEIMTTGSNDVYVVRGSGREYLLPAIKDVVCRVDPGGGTILVRPMEGMLD